MPIYKPYKDNLGIHRQVSLPGISKVYVGNSLVYDKDGGSWHELSIDSSQNQAGYHLGTSYIPTGNLCTLDSLKKNIKLRVTFEVYADSSYTQHVIEQSLNYPERSLSNGTWTKEFEFNKNNQLLTLIKNDILEEAFTRLDFYLDLSTDVLTLRLNADLDDIYTSNDIYLKVTKVEQFY